MKYVEPKNPHIPFDIVKREVGWVERDNEAFASLRAAERLYHKFRSLSNRG